MQKMDKKNLKKKSQSHKVMAYIVLYDKKIIQHIKFV